MTDRSPHRARHRARLPAGRALLALAALAALAGCTMATGYTAAGGASTYGYSEEQVDPTTWKVKFAGNSATSRDQVESMLLYRAAELARNKGADHFVVLDQDIERDTAYRGTGYPFSPFGYYHYGFGFGRPLLYRPPYPHTAFGFGFPYGNPAALQPIHRYTGHATLRLFRAAPPAGLGVPYETAKVLRTLGPKVAPTPKDGAGDDQGGG